jgi:hypothetical protein
MESILICPSFTLKHLARFEAFIDKTESCWIWIGPCGHRGHGLFHFGAKGQITAHRAAYLIAFQTIPKGLDVFRKCRNHLCVRPDHLELDKPHTCLLTTLERLHQKSKLVESGCVLFTGHRDKCGYGKFNKTLAHRAAWELHKGAIPPNMYVLHKCDNPPCINVDHLFIGTQKDNMQDMARKGRQSRIGAPKGHIGANRHLTEEQVIWARTAYINGELNMPQIAIVLKIDPSAVSRMINGKMYKQVKLITELLQESILEVV